MTITLDMYWSKIFTSSDCINYGGDWINSVQNFDNVLQGVAVLFQMLTTDAWTDIMFKMVDFAGIGNAPIPQNNFMWSYFAMVLIVITNFLILNFFAGVLMDTFTSEKNKLGGLSSLSNTQKQWVDLQVFVIHQNVQSKVKKPKNKFRQCFYNFWISKTWRIIDSILIVVSALAFWMVYHRQAEGYYSALTYIQIITFFCFLVEVSLKIFTYGKYFVRERKLLVDILILLIEGVSL
jgi:Ion transport protein